MKVTVTDQDIQDGLPRIAARCPVALALRRALKVRDVVVGHKMFFEIGLHMGTVILSRDVPEEVNAFIARFDKELSVTPFEFDL